MDAAQRNYIICRALYLALVGLERRPEDQRPQIDWDDMVEMINEPQYQDLIEAVTEFEERHHANDFFVGARSPNAFPAPLISNEPPRIKPARCAALPLNRLRQMRRGARAVGRIEGGDSRHYKAGGSPAKTPSAIAASMRNCSVSASAVSVMFGPFQFFSKSRFADSLV